MGDPPHPHPVGREPGPAVVEDRRHPPQELSLDHPPEVLQEPLGAHPDLLGRTHRRDGPMTAIGPWRARITATSARRRAARLELARRRGVDRRRQRLGPLLHLEVHVDLEQGQGGELADRLGAGLGPQHLQGALEPQLGVRGRGDREPEVELVRAEVVVGDAGVGVDDPRGALGVLRVDLGGDQHRRIAERPGVEDRRDLADDPLVEQPLGARLNLVHRQLRLAGDGRERLALQREARLEQVQEQLVGRVQRHRGARLARASLGPRRAQRRAGPAQSQAAASLA